MATENQIKALEKWLGIPLMDMNFKVASAYLDRLHKASEEYKKDKKGKKGIVKKVKVEITAELQKLGLVVDEEGVKVDKKKASHRTLAEEKAQPEEGNGVTTTEIEEEVHKIGVVMRYAVREATAIVEQEINNGGIGEASKAGILQRIATTMFIEGMRRGL